MALLPVKRKERNGSDLARLHRDMDDLFRGFFGDWDWPSWRAAGWPAIDIAENDDAYVVKVEVPGCKADDVDIALHGNTLIIRGDKKEQDSKEEKGYYHVERSFGRFQRELNLASDVEADKIQASCENGILTITLPKSEKAKPVKIKVKGS